jgi:hypothetical protein
MVDDLLTEIVAPPGVRSPRRVGNMSTPKADKSSKVALILKLIREVYRMEGIAFAR